MIRQIHSDFMQHSVLTSSISLWWHHFLELIGYCILTIRTSETCVRNIFRCLCYYKLDDQITAISRLVKRNRNTQAVGKPLYLLMMWHSTRPKKDRFWTRMLARKVGCEKIIILRLGGELIESEHEHVLSATRFYNPEFERIRGNFIHGMAYTGSLQDSTSEIRGKIESRAIYHKFERCSQ